MIIAIILIVVCILGSYVVYRLFSAEVTFEGHGIYSVSLGKNETEEGWNLPALSMTYEGEEGWRGSNIIYKLRYANSSNWLENGTLESIKDSPSGYGIRWYDKDNDDHLSVGDVIFISKAGGSTGTVISEEDYKLVLILGDNCVYESPGL